ncbi:MAG: type II secretion system F family protein [Syntrophomonadaceae bacterium]|nr:type II secretion system F family protein [Syntrophomonadaceae bacterium]
MELSICLAVFGLVFFGTLALLKTLFQYDLYQKRLESLGEGNSAESRPQIKWNTSVRFLIKKVSRLFAARSFTGNLQAQLIGAGLPFKAEEFITLSLALIMLFPLCLYFLTGNFWLGLIVGLGGIYIPKMYLNYHKEKRLQNLNIQLGDALVVMANALRAGFGFQQAMDTVRKELPAPISTEFNWALQEMNLGFSQEEALLNLGSRAQSEDLDMVISGVIIQRQVGGNLAEILDNISGTIRERSRIRREVKILTAQGRLSGLIIGLLPVVLIAIMLVINPAYFNVMLKDTRGIFLLSTAVVFEIIGFIIIQKIIDIDF